MRATGYFAVILLGSTTPAQAQWTPPLWTHGATCYEVFVRSFYDSNGDGIGDIPGLIAKLDYINDGNPQSRRSLGARCIWLMPVAESPSYHGYDVTDYYRVERDYGTNDDFKRLVAEAHKRGIKVLVDMVLNHTSSENPWFQSALRDPASPYRAWYRWSPTKVVEKNWGGEVWHHSPVRDEYYYGLFWGGMPDLNYMHPPVMAEMKKVARFWLQDMGVDGFRLDAVPYLVEGNGQVAHTGGTHGVLHDYGAYVRSVKPDAFTIGEVTYPNDILLTYYPEQLDSYFAFEIADSIITAVRSGSAKGLLAPLLRLQGDVPANRWSPFLRNHDQPRTRTELSGDMALSRIASFLLLTMPGVPFVYYGEEIGMIGAKPDERLRTPMQWSPAPGAGFTRGRPWERLQDDSLTTTVEAQDKDPSSLLALHRRLIHLRDANTALGVGELVALTASANAVAAYIRRDGDRAVLVIANLSRAPVSGVSLTSQAEALRPGRRATRNLLGGSAVAPLRVGDDGQLHGYVPLATLAPLEGYLIELSAPSDGRR
jgi:alpha-amylase